MTTKTKILLGISLTAFAVSLTGAFRGQFLPVGAICFGLFLIFKLLEKETALFDKEQRLRVSLAEKNPASAQPVRQMQRESSGVAAPAH